MDFIGGYGVDPADGNPKNIISIMLRSAEIFKGYNQETGEWSAAGDIEDARALVQKFTKAQEDLSNQHVSFLEAQAGLPAASAAILRTALLKADRSPFC